MYLAVVHYVLITPHTSHLTPHTSQLTRAGCRQFYTWDHQIWSVCCSPPHRESPYPPWCCSSRREIERVTNCIEELGYSRSVNKMDEWIKYEILEKPSDHRQRTLITLLVFDRNKMWMIFSIKHFNNIYDLARTSNNSIVRRYVKDNKSNYLPQCHCGCILGYLPSSCSQLHNCPGFIINWNNARTCFLCCQDLHGPLYLLSLSKRGYALQRMNEGNR